MGKGIFFWLRKSKSQEEKAEEMMKLVMKYLPQARQMMNSGATQISDGRIIGQMYDFYQDFDNTRGAEVQPWREFNDLPANEQQAQIDAREAKKPVDVVQELDTVPMPWSVDEESLDDKISLFKDKDKLSNQRYAKDQIQGFIKRLENRKKYKQHLNFFSSFPNTTDEKIDALLDKYKLDMEKSELFVPTFPKEAIDVMKKYADVCAKITDEAPVFYVIAEEKDFKEKRKKLDPILLVQSPFGFYWQILGAWDKEMLLLHEL